MFLSKNVRTSKKFKFQKEKFRIIFKIDQKQKKNRKNSLKTNTRRTSWQPKTEKTGEKSCVAKLSCNGPAHKIAP
jgi:hypothetical protein